MLILRAKIGLNAVICMHDLIHIFLDNQESWLLQNVGFYRSFLQFYVINQTKRLVINNLYSYSPNIPLGLLAQ